MKLKGGVGFVKQAGFKPGVKESVCIRRSLYSDNVEWKCNPQIRPSARWSVNGDVWGLHLCSKAQAVLLSKW